jgi:hypothetical protein
MASHKKRDVNSSGNESHMGHSGIFSHRGWDLFENTTQFRGKLGKELTKEWMDSCWLVPMEAMSGRLWI